MPALAYGKNVTTHHWKCRKLQWIKALHLHGVGGFLHPLLSVRHGTVNQRGSPYLLRLWIEL